MESPNGGRRRRPCFIEEDDGLVSLAETEAGFSGNNNKKLNQYPLISRSLYYTKNLSSILSPRSVVFEEPQQHFLEACFLCKKRLAHNSDIFMYRGDTPFCSEECRKQQIEKDEAKEKKWKISSLKALRKKEKSESTSPSKTTEDYPLRPGTVAAA